MEFRAKLTFNFIISLNFCTGHHICAPSLCALCRIPFPKKASPSGVNFTNPFAINANTMAVFGAQHLAQKIPFSFINETAPNYTSKHN